MGTTGTSEERRVDEKGRVTIPQSIRESLRIGPGETVEIERSDGHIIVRPRISRAAFVDTMAGCVNDETRAADASPRDPLDMKADWTSDLP